MLRPLREATGKLFFEDLPLKKYFYLKEKKGEQNYNHKICQLMLEIGTRLPEV